MITMIRIYRKRLVRSCLLLLAGILLAVNPLVAQQGSGSLQTDTAVASTEERFEPGALFPVRKRSSTAAVSTVSGEVLYKTPVPNLTNTLYGLLPGLTVSQGSGEPGNDAATLNIRGIGSYNRGNYSLYIDGFQTDLSYFQYLAPGEIESVSILKDAAALATFGMKGANGVMWVTTKRGHIGKPKIQLQTRTGFQQPININKPLGSYDYARFYNEALSNDDGRIWKPAYSDAQLDAYKTGSGTNVDWYDEVLKKQAAFTTADASISGGDSSARYFVMLGYLGQQGLYNVSSNDTHSNAGLKIYTIRTNLDFNMFKIFEGKVGIGGRIEDRRYPNYNGNSLWANLARYPSNIYPVKNDDGSWTGTGTFPDNPLASINELGYNSTHDRTLQANFNLKEKLDFITPGLYLSQGASFNTWTRGTYNVTKDYARFIGTVPQTTQQNTNYSIFDDRGTNQWSWNQLEALVGYNRKFGEHELTAAVSYLQYTYSVDSNRNGAAGLNINYGYQNAGGKIHYVHNDRYSAEFGFAYSGSDNYAKGNRWGFYPAVSAAWNISKESFLRGSKHLDLLKLRASAGKSAYDNFSGGRYLYQLYYFNSGSFPTGNGTPTWRNGIRQGYVPNADIFAEQSLKYNIGIDASLFSKLVLTADIFLDKRSGIVTPDNSLMAVFGTTPAYRNIGKVTSKGFEASINYHDKVGNFDYNIGGIASLSSNRIDYMSEVPPVSPKAAQTGAPVGSTFGYVANGFYDVTDFNTNGSLSNNLPVPGFGAVQPGDIKYIDQNGDNRIDQADLVKVGKSYFPQFTYAFHVSAAYKGIDFRVLFQGAASRTVNLLDAGSQAIAFVNNANVYALAENRWAYYPDRGSDTRASATYPRLTTTANNNNYINSTFWMKNGSFLRLRNIEIGYNLPASLQRNLGLSNTRIFVNGMNLLTFSSLSREYNIDPETMIGYPSMKSINAGLTVNF